MALTSTVAGRIDCTSRMPSGPNLPLSPRATTAAKAGPYEMEFLDQTNHVKQLLGKKISQGAVPVIPDALIMNHNVPRATVAAPPMPPAQSIMP